MELSTIWHLRSNRTFMELKFKEGNLRLREMTSSNRTFMELKF